MRRRIVSANRAVATQDNDPRVAALPLALLNQLYDIERRASQWSDESRWWTENDRAEFEKRANRLVSQYDAYEPLPGMPLSGRFTLGENIGDLGGLSVAYTAYRLSLGGKPGPVLEGFTGEQRFFIGWAQVWRRKYREEEMRRRIKTDPHSPSAYRCNGIVSNLDGFYDAFKIDLNDPMYLAPDQRVRIW